MKDYYTRASWLNEQPDVCAYCQRKVGSKAKFGYWSRKTVDHVIPLARRGRDVPSNWKVCCRACNEDKGILTMDEWNLVREFREKNGNPHPHRYAEHQKPATPTSDESGAV